MLQIYQEAIESSNIVAIEAKTELIVSIRNGLTELMEADYKDKFYLGLDQERELFWMAFVGDSTGFYFENGNIYDNVVVNTYFKIWPWPKIEPKPISLDDIPFEKYSDSTLSDIVQEIESAHSSLASSTK